MQLVNLVWFIFIAYGIIIEEVIYIFGMLLTEYWQTHSNRLVYI